MERAPSPAPRSPSLKGWLYVGVPIVAGLGLLAWPWLSTVSSSMADTRVPKPAAIDGQRAYDYLKAICDIGPRPAGSAANTKQRAMVAAHFTKHGGKVREQPFTGTDPLSKATVPMVNLIGSWFPERTERVLLAAHYDTRPFPDRDPDPARRKDPFIGANDGASGVALLMEIAHHLKDSPTPWGVDLVLFDGEELVYDQEGDYFLGSKEFAKQYAEAPKDAKQSRYVAALVLDMVGDKDLNIDQEQYSLELAPNLVREVWTVATKLKEQRTFRPQVGMAVNDDHLPLNNAGIPTIDLIDFDYKYWHTANDVPKNCSGTSLAKVGRVVTGWLSLPKAPEPRRR